MAMERSSSSRVAFFLLFLTLALAGREGSAAAEVEAAASADGEATVVIVVLKVESLVEAALAIQAHDLSLAGFRNRSGHWHMFPGHGHILIASGSEPTLLPFGNTYRDLIGGLANLPNLPLGRLAMAQASNAVAGYTSAATVDDDVKRALATLTVTTCEAQRLQPIRDLLTKGWDGGEARVAVEHLPYIEHWDTICYEILRAEKNGVWDGPFTELLREHANIKNKEEALAVVGVITTSRTLQDLVVAHARRA